MSWLTFKIQASDPGTPASGEIRIYGKTDDQLYQIDDTGTVTPLTGVPLSRVLTAGAGLVGGGDLTANRTFDVAANADGSIVVNADDIQVGVLATDAQHGQRGNGNLHDVATTSAEGFLPQLDDDEAHFLDGDGKWSGVKLTTLPARKGSSGTISRGTPVYLDAYNPSGYIEVEEADADDPTKMPAIGLAYEDITSTATARVITFGILSGFDTSSWTVKDPLYVSPTVGTLQNTRPIGATDLIQRVAVVLRSNASVGEVLVQGAGRTNDTQQITQGKIWVGDANNKASETDWVHNTRHVRGGADEIDGDTLDIDYTPTNYTPVTTPSEVTNVDELTAHLAGIDSALAPGATMACVQARKSSAHTVSTTWSNVVFDQTDVESDDTIVNHDDSSRDRIYVYETGVYLITYAASFDHTDTVSGDPRVDIRVQKNGSGVVSGSGALPGNHYSGSGALFEGASHGQALLVTLTAGDYVSLQMQRNRTTTGTLSTIRHPVMTVTRLKAPKGDTGATGSGSNINLKDGGVSVPNTPHSTIDFSDGFEVSDAGSGEADVVAAPSVTAIESTTLTTTTSTTDVTLSGMTTTPGAGTWLVEFTGETFIDADNRTITMSIYVNGTKATASERQHWYEKKEEFWNYNLRKKVTVTGSQVVDIRWRVSADTGSVTNRQMFLTRCS